MDYATAINPRRGAPAEMKWLTVGVLLTALPHMLHTPPWSSLLFVMLILLRLLLAQKTARRLFGTSHLVKIFLAAVIFGGVFLNFGTMVGRDAGVTLLMLLGGMKLLEIRSERDYYIAAFIGFLLILTNFFYTQTLPVSLYLAASLLVLIAALISFNDRGGEVPVLQRLQGAGTLFLHALPLMILMFVLFPRVSGPLWGLPKDAQSGITGMDDEMSPGSISQLILSDEVAFRVEFEAGIPQRSELYWRGPVLWYTDGFKWVPERPRPAGEGRLIPAGAPFSYSVTLEPTDRNWLYALEQPAGAPEDSYLSQDMQIRTRRPVLRRTRYQLSSYTDYVLLADAPADVGNALQLPRSYHPKAVAMGRSWRAEGLDAAGIVDRALDYFREQDFYYTLAPPVLNNDTVDEFLFGTRQGFCEHYAAAFTVLMRAAGIPARVVTGYQGGTVNPVGNYLIVRQRDAHAWTEVWLEGRGWVRVDPTSAVSPARVTDGIGGSLPDTLIDVPFGLYNNSFTRNLWERMSNTFDALNNRWNQWVLGYDRNRQRLLLRNVGLDLNRDELMICMVVVLSLGTGLLAWWLLKQRRTPQDKARRWYDRYRRRLHRAGIGVYDYEGPVDLARRAGSLRADLAAAVHAITETYVEVRYQNRLERFDELKHRVKSFKPAPRAGSVGEP